MYSLFVFVNSAGQERKETDCEELFFFFSFSMTTSSSSTIPCLILETYCLPISLKAPQEVLRLIGVGCTHHNAGRIVDAVDAFIEAEQAWEREIACQTLMSLQPAASSPSAGDQRQQPASFATSPTVGYQRPLTMDDVDAVPILVSLARQETEQEAERVAVTRRAKKAAIRKFYELLQEKEKWEMEQGPLVVAAEDEEEGAVESDKHMAVGRDGFQGSAVLKEFCAQYPQLRTSDEAIVELKQAEKQSSEADERYADLVAQRVRNEEKRASDRLQSVLHATHQVPITARVVIQLLIASALQSGANDGRALRSLLHALELAQTSSTGSSSDGPGPLILASIYAALGVVYFHLSQYDFAADYFFRSLEIRENLLPSNHVDLAASLNNVAAVLTVLRRPQDGLVFFNQALQCFIDESADDLEHAVRQFSSTVIPENTIRVNGACSARYLTIQQNIRLATVSSCDWVPPAVPFPAVPVVPPMIPGARRAKAFFRPKPKKAKVDPKAKK